MKLPTATCSTKKVHAIDQRLLIIPITTAESITITTATVNFIVSPLQAYYLINARNQKKVTEE
jgi:hypothetical protein